MPTATASTSPAQNRAHLHAKNKSDDAKSLTNFRIRVLHYDPMKKLQKLDKNLHFWEESISLILFLTPNDVVHYSPAIKRFLEAKMQYFNISKSNPYKYNRIAEGDFILKLIKEKEKDKSLQGASHKEALECLKELYSTGKKVEEKQEQYQQWLKMCKNKTIKQSPLKLARPDVYMLEIELQANAFAEDGTVYTYVNL